MGFEWLMVCAVNYALFMKTKYSETLLAQARKIQAVALDCDGTLTDNTEVTGFDAPFVHGLLKRRSHYDGQGISLLRAIGIKVAIITGEGGGTAGARMVSALVERWNNLPSVESGEWAKVDLYTDVFCHSKVAALDEWLRKIGISPEHCAAMGDDLVDFQMLRAVGFRACPITAEAVIKETADFISERPAGYGAVRDLANLILTARGIDPTTLPTK